MSRRATPNRWLPHPALSLLLAGSWLLLQQSLAPGHLVIATVLAIALPRLLDGFLAPGVRVRNLPVAIRLLLVVLADIVTANVTVARIVLGLGPRPIPAWVTVNLDLADPVAITLLATIITTTPGTVSCLIDEEGHRIIVHALDCHDPAAMAAQIKQRYERPLKEIFE